MKEPVLLGGRRKFLSMVGGAIAVAAPLVVTPKCAFAAGKMILVSYGGTYRIAIENALVKPFSGSAARAMLIETMKTHGVDSFPALIAATVQGSTETTFYVLAVYFGAVGIQRARHAVACALLADLAGVVASVGVCYWFFG